MNYWLVKSEPEAWSWDDHVKAGVTHWDGVRNAQAQNNMKAMRKGDRVLFYHSVKEKQIVGLTEVTREAYADPTDDTGKHIVVDLKALRPLPQPVPLADIKADEKLAHLALVRQGRLSVMPVDAASYKRLCRMGGLKDA